MPKKDKAEVFVATESGACEIDGEPLIFTKGITRVRAGHPLLKAVPDYFAPVEDRVHYDLEQATAQEWDAFIEPLPGPHFPTATTINAEAAERAEHRGVVFFESYRVFSAASASSALNVVVIPFHL